MPTIMAPTNLLDFSVQVLMILVMVMSLRRLYFTFNGLIEFVAWMEALTEVYPLAWLSPVSWITKVLSCRTCFTYWLTLFCSGFIVFVVPHLSGWVVWAIAMPAIAWSVNHIFDPSVTAHQPLTKAETMVRFTREAFPAVDEDRTAGTSGPPELPAA